MSTIFFVGLGACAISILSATVYAFGSAVGYRRGREDQRQTDPQRRTAQALVLEEALSPARRN